MLINMEGCRSDTLAAKQTTQTLSIISPSTILTPRSDKLDTLNGETPEALKRFRRSFENRLLRDWRARRSWTGPQAGRTVVRLPAQDHQGNDALGREP